jgi:hypothetical protein
MRQPLVFVTSILLLGMAARSSPQHHDHAAAAQQAEQQPEAHQHASEAMAGAGGHLQHGAHLKMTSRRPASPDDARRADAIVAGLTASLERYKDYRVAIGDGFQPVLPQLPLPEHHFTSSRNAFVGAFTFDPAKPTSLLYRKRGSGYDLVGAMYTAPRWFTEGQLHERVPLSVAAWHAHVNICLPPQGARPVDWSRFGFRGSIASEAACREAEGRWFPQLFGWMVHVYPYERTPGKIWAH